MRLFLFLFWLCLACSKNTDPAAPVSAPPPVRAHHSLIYHAAEKRILLTGGSTPLQGGNSFEFYQDLWAFDGTTWKALGETGSRRSGMALAYDSKRNRVYSFGGFDGSSYLADLRVLENGRWTMVAELPDMRGAEGGMVYDSDRDRLILFGGSAGMNQVNADTWEWDGAFWTKFSGPGPGGRQAFVLAYDPVRKKTVLFGGMGTSPAQKFHDTWTFDGSAWTKVTDIGPGNRASAGCAYDLAHQYLLIFGGSGDAGFSPETWAWDGVEWKKLADTGPAPRAMGYLAYDALRNKTVLFGGRLGWPNDANDTWEWDGDKWSEWK